MIRRKQPQVAVNLRIERLEKSRSGRSLCYIDENVMFDLGLSTGDIIEIKGRKRTTGIAVSSAADKGKGIIRLDLLQRLNAGATIGENISILKAEVYPAIEIQLTPTRPDIDLKRQADAIKNKLIDKPVVIGDIVDVYGTFVQREEGENPMSDLMKKFQLGSRKRATLGTLRLIVENLKPPDKVVKITRDTVIKVNKKVAALNHTGDVFTYNHIGGLSDEIQKIREIVELPLKYPELFHRLRVKPSQGIILYGIPGVGKTLLIKALTHEIKANFITINGPEIFSRYSGGTEGRLREIFREAEENAPSIIFIDKIDAIAPKRELLSEKVEQRVVAQLLTLMDGIQSRGDVIVIAETNRIEDIDEGLRRPGRFDHEIEIKPPDIDGRFEILKIHTRGKPLHKDVDLKLIAEKTQGFVGADLMALCKEAAMDSIRSVLPQIKLNEVHPDDALNTLIIKMEHFNSALECIKPAILRFS